MATASSRGKYAQTLAQAFLAAHAAELLQGVVHPDVAQVGVHEGHADRGPSQELHHQRVIRPPLSALRGAVSPRAGGHGGRILSLALVTGFHRCFAMAARG